MASGAEVHASDKGLLLIVGLRLKELLRKRLKECGWRDQLKEQCKGEALSCWCSVEVLTVRPTGLFLH